MKILIVQNEYALSGAPMCAFDIAVALKSQGHEVFPIAPAAGELVKMYQEKGITPNAHPEILANPKVAYELAKQVDLVIVFTSVALQAVFGAKGAGKPVIFSIHEFNELGVHMARDNILFRQALNISDHVTFTCDYAVKQFRPYLTHNNVSTAIVGTNVIDISTFPKKTGESFKLITVGSIEPRKNQLGAIAAVTDMPGVELTIIGRPLHQGYVNQVVAKAKEAKNVTVAANVPQEEVHKIMNTHDMVFCASLDETIPRFIMEGMALGKPILSSNITGIPEVVKEDITGKLFNVYNIEEARTIIKSLQANPEHVALMGKNARKAISEQFNLESYTNVFKEIITRWQ